MNDEKTGGSEELERRLRAAGRRRRPVAPADLRAFIDTVPELPAAEHPGGFRARSGRVGLALGGIAAGIVAVAVSGLLLSYRQGLVPDGFAGGSHAASHGASHIAPATAGRTGAASAAATAAASRASATPKPTPAPTNMIPGCPNAKPMTAPPAEKQFVADGVSWASPQGIPNLSVMAVPNGYVGTVWFESCQVNVVYTSRDGVGWTTPPDPAIFVNQSAEPFTVGFFPVVKGPAGYVFGGERADASPVVWSSTDGLHWTARSPDGIPYAAGMLHIYLTQGGYLASDLDNYWTSPDGVTWQQASYDAWRLIRGEPGQPMLAGGEGNFSWFSLDGGKTWGQTGYAPGQKLLEWVAPFGGLYYGDWEIGGQFTLFTTRDMRSWARVNVKGPASPATLTAFAGRLYAVDLPADMAQHGTLWSTSDGTNWTQVLDDATHPVAADNLWVEGGQLFVSGDRVWVARQAG